MNKNNSKCGKEFWNLTLPFEVERLMQLDDEFMSDAEVQKLLRKKSLLYDRIINYLPEELKSEIVEYDDVNFYIGDLKRKFYYKRGFIDCRAIMRFLVRCKNNIKLNISIR